MDVEIGETTWVAVCASADVVEGEGHRVELSDLPEPLALFRVDGEVRVIADTCSHGQASLAEGWVEGSSVECPFHLARFDLSSGAPLCLPALLPVRTFQAVERDGAVLVRTEG